MSIANNILNIHQAFYFKFKKLNSPEGGRFTGGKGKLDLKAEYPKKNPGTVPTVYVRQVPL